MKPGVIKEINIYPKEQREGSKVSRVNCLKGIGLEGDRFAKGGDRQISLLDETIEGAKQEGICYQKFRGNLIISGLDFSNLIPGDKLSIGEVGLQVSEFKKRCYGEECPRYRDGHVCEILQGCLFASIIRSGQIEIGMDVIKKTPSML